MSAPIEWSRWSRWDEGGLRQAYQRAEDAAARVRDRLACRRRGHLWDTDRPAGPIHKRDICWRCNAVREEKR